jgi:hypothetical protein
MNDELGVMSKGLTLWGDGWLRISFFQSFFKGGNDEIFAQNPAL